MNRLPEAEIDCFVTRYRNGIFNNPKWDCEDDSHIDRVKLLLLQFKKKNKHVCVCVCV